MKVLVIGSGGREHTLVWKLSQSPKVEKIYAAPGNGGIASSASCVDINANDIPALKKFADDNKIDLTIVGPEDPLAQGIVDVFTEKDLPIFGPTGSAARIESSKSFAKEIMKKYDIPTAASETFENSDDAVDYIKAQGAPIVIKADGLAAGKGVIPCTTMESALEAVQKIMVDKVFGDAGNKVVVEEFLEGEEASILAFSDGSTVIPMASSQDHKRAYDNDEGPNTGGMGAYSPAPVVTDEISDDIYCKILVPTIEGMKESGIEYKGILYAGLMITENGPRVIEFNCRFGDPELQVVLPRLKTDLVEPVMACINGNLDQVHLEWDPRAAVCVVMASGGYPGKYEKGKPIEGLANAEEESDITIFHAGTAQKDDKYITSGGRVLGVTALGNDIPTAIEHAYTAVNKINFENVYYRKDIGQKALKRLG
ncbi:MAG: phosphoribosylamine--glycine ligase [Thermoplasmata archaeon]|nr:MAG: phosphoribosylamine--glycine ligase [Thermoplasmata archaeon]